MRFAIRDLLWATLVVAMGLGWWVSYRAVDAKRLEAVGQAHRLRSVVSETHFITKILFGGKHPSQRNCALDIEPKADWSDLDEPLIEP